MCSSIYRFPFAYVCLFSSIEHIIHKLLNTRIVVFWEKRQKRFETRRFTQKQMKMFEFNLLIDLSFVNIPNFELPVTY